LYIKQPWKKRTRRRRRKKGAHRCVAFHRAKPGEEEEEEKKRSTNLKALFFLFGFLKVKEEKRKDGRVKRIGLGYQAITSYSLYLSIYGLEGCV
jgi:hypothetical protein